MPLPSPFTIGAAPMPSPVTIRVETIAGTRPEPWPQSQRYAVPPVKMSGTAIVDAGTDVKRGMSFTFQDARTRMTGTVTRRYKLRNGTIKLWLEPLTEIALSNSLHI